MSAAAARDRGVAGNGTHGGEAPEHEVVIVGGGLAGLCLAIQLKQRDADIDVLVLERAAHPVPEVAFKVGESTVEIGAHYFADVLGLREHLDADQVRKFGFRFFFSEGREQVDACTEIGVSQPLPTPSWQIDRGRFENFLGERARTLGVDFRDGANVRRIGLAEGEGDEGGRARHRVEYERDGTRRQLAARWLVDASGRAGLLRRQLGLAQDHDHDAHAVWWRVDGRLDPNDWSADADWLRRCDPPDRWRSTNHLCGPGYWVWMIPLAPGAHSIGIVADSREHPLAGMDSHDKAMAWLREHQPRLARALDQRSGDDADQPRHELRDFRFLRRFSHGCRRMFSADRWALTGEAGMFLDPFYSPGSDFIAIANGYICDLVAHDRGGRPVAAHAEVYEQLYRSFNDSMLGLYRGQYPLFGDALVMPLKVIWDYTYYWSLLAPLYFAGRLSALPVLARLRADLDRATALNAAMQPLLRAWGERNRAGTTDRRGPLDGRNLDQYRIGWFHELNRALGDELDDSALLARIRGNVALMQRLAAQLLAHARDAHAGIDGHGLDAQLAGVVAGEPLLPAAWCGRQVELESA